MASCSEGDFLTALTGGGNVAFTQDCSITLSAPVQVTMNTTIDAQGYAVTLNGGGQVQLLRVGSYARLTLIGLTLTGGTSTNGGALYIDGTGTAWLTNCTLTGNTAVGTNGLDGLTGSTNNANGVGGSGGNGGTGKTAGGGAIYNLGNLLIQNCILATNSATGGAGGAGGAGGSEVNQGGNGGIGGAGAPAYGGAIYNLNNLTMTNCTFAGNTATGGAGGAGGAGGGGAFAAGLAGKGGAGAGALGGGLCNSLNVNVSACTFSGNSAQGGASAAGGNQSNGVGSTGARGGDASGGGLYSASWGQVVNCTFNSNKVTGGTGGNGGDGSGGLPQGGNGGDGGNGNGGGLDNLGTMVVTNCTVAFCSAQGGTNGAAGSGSFPGSAGNPGAANGGGVANLSGSVTFANSILATNSPGLNAYGTIVAGGYNLSSDNTPSSLTSASRNKDPGIGALGSNGGVTQTIPLLSTNSPAYAKIPAGSPGLPPTDERGVPRPAPGKAYADLGAYELHGTTPAIIGQPPAITIQTNGGSVNLTVSASGNALRYQWQFTPANFYYGDILVPGGAVTNFALAAVSNLPLSSITITNAGSYVVMVTNISAANAAVTSSPAVLRVPPYIVIQPTNAETFRGFEAMFAVVAAADQPVTYQWFSNQTNAIPGATASSYTVGNARLTNSGWTYSVVVTNSLGNVTSVLATLTVDAPPAITVPPTNTVVVQGADTRFYVGATGTPPLSYQWRFNGQPTQGATSTTYPIYGAQGANAGNYDVIITNSFGSVTSTPPATLTLLAVQVVPTILTNVNVGANGFSFSFYGLSNLTYVVQTNQLGSFSNWTGAATYQGSNASIRFQDPATNQSSRFYRVLTHQ